MASTAPRSTNSWLCSKWAPLMTHACTLAMTAALFALLLLTPFWVAALPCILLHHRIGILVHEYIHGIPFSKYKHNHGVVTIFDGVFLAFGFFELFRSTHLIHHKWLNTDKDPAFQTAHAEAPKNRLLYFISMTEAAHHIKFFLGAIQGNNPIINPRYILYGAVLSSVHIVFWWLVGLPEVVLYLLSLSAFTALVSSSLRGAIEHHSFSGDPRSTNEYKSFIPLFNMDKHVHHHMNPTLPWYRLEYQTDRVLPVSVCITHWYKVYVKKEFVMMPPEKGGYNHRIQK